MIERFRHTALILLASMTLFSCIDNIECPEPIMPNPDPVEDADMVFLSLSVSVNDISRANKSRQRVVTTPDDDNYFEAPLLPCEKMQSLRVIILRPGGNGSYTIEHNHYIPFDSPGLTLKTGLNYAVRGGEYKMLYLIANENIVGYDFDALNVGDNCTSGFMEAITFGPASGVTLIDNELQSEQPVPMSESYHFFVPDGVAKQEFDAGTLFLTRAAVKFSFKVNSVNCEGLKLKSISFNQLSDKQYLLPHNTTYLPAKVMPDLYTPTPSPGIGDLGGRFITAYSVPADAGNSPYTFKFDEPYALNSENSEFEIHPQQYFCESQYDNPYALGVTLAGDDDYEMAFAPVQLPNLPILPRNTHVVVNMDITPHVIKFRVSVEPWAFGGRTEIDMSPTE